MFTSGAEALVFPVYRVSWLSAIPSSVSTAMKYEIPNNGYYETCNHLNCKLGESFGLYYSAPLRDIKDVISAPPDFVRQFTRPLRGTEYAVRADAIQSALDEASEFGSINVFAFGSGPRIQSEPVPQLVSELRVWFKK